MLCDDYFCSKKTKEEEEDLPPLLQGPYRVVLFPDLLLPEETGHHRHRAHAQVCPYRRKQETRRPGGFDEGHPFWPWLQSQSTQNL